MIDNNRWDRRRLRSQRRAAMLAPETGMTELQSFHSLAHTVVEKLVAVAYEKILCFILYADVALDSNSWGAKLSIERRFNHCSSFFPILRYPRTATYSKSTQLVAVTIHELCESSRKSRSSMALQMPEHNACILFEFEHDRLFPIGGILCALTFKLKIQIVGRQSAFRQCRELARRSQSFLAQHWKRSSYKS
jgi:hypothetical protein